MLALTLNPFPSSQGSRVRPEPQGRHILVTAASPAMCDPQVTGDGRFDKSPLRVKRGSGVEGRLKAIERETPCPY